ncbi:transposase [Okeania sp. SIO1I7]|uniref:transposase n=1 Tax=Okeania sp. SIO1I7 TaxID=2607772 RepID=UPI0025EC6FFB|nr:transposase [Okeania sp. SIO1I7]
MRDISHTKNHRFYPEIDRLCFLSKNLYNYANYLVRQSFIFEHNYRHYYDLQKILHTQSDYQAIPAKVSQQILMILDRNTEEFFSSKRSLSKEPIKV